MAIGAVIILVFGFVAPRLGFTSVVTSYRGYDIYYSELKDQRGLPPYFIGGGDIPGDFWSISAAKAAIDSYLGPSAPTNSPPNAKVNGPYSGKVGYQIFFKSTGSSDPDGDAIVFKWNFGDGKTSTNANPSHAYSSAGTYTVKLTVTDEHGASDSASTSCSVSEPPPPNEDPYAEANGPYSGKVGEAISFSGSGSSDPDGSISEYRWSFGDGSAYAYGKTVTHSYSSPGTYTATLRVKDNDGATDSDSATVTVTQLLPDGHFIINGQQVTDTMTLNTNSFNVEFVATAAPSAVTRVQFRAWIDGTLKVDVDLTKVSSNTWQKTVTLSDGVYVIQGDIHHASGSIILLSMLAGVGEDVPDPLLINPEGILVGAAVFAIGAVIRFRQPKRRRR